MTHSPLPANLRTTSGPHFSSIGPAGIAIDLKVLKGDLTPFSNGYLHHSPDQKAASGVIALFQETEFQTRNRDLCAPLLMAGLSGDVTSQRLYEALRLIHPCTTPDPLRLMIERALENTFPKQEIFLTGSTRRVVSVKPTLPPSDSAAFGLERATYASASAMIATSTNRRVHSESDLKAAADIALAHLASGDASIATPVIGSIYARFSGEAALLLLKAKILEDARAVLSLPIEDRKLEHVFRTMQRPWEVGRHSSIARGIELKRIFIQHPGLASMQHMLFSAPDLARAVRQLTAVTQLRPTAPSTQRTTTPSPAAQLRTALTGSINAALMVLQDSPIESGIVENLANRIEDQRLGYADLITALRNGADVSTLHGLAFGSAS